MARQYKRTYDLTVITPEGEGRVIRNNRINFEIIKSVISYPNLARITIYGLEEETLSFFQQRNSQLILNAGYEGSSRLLFKGEIRNVFQERIPPDKFITVYAGDGSFDWQNSIFNRTFNENVSLQSMIQELAATFKDITIRTLEGVPEISGLLEGVTLSGKSSDLLDSFAREYGFSWSIQNGEFVAVADEQPIQGDEAVLISAATGMIGSPTITETNVGVGGVEVTTQLNPMLQPNVAFIIESVSASVALGNLFFRQIPKTTAEGLYKTQEVTFRGDSKEGDWVSTVKGRAVNV